jgi:UTP--glucose-1-phosphate uridylyltransferase
LHLFVVCLCSNSSFFFKKALLPIQGSETFLSAVVTSVASLNSTFNGLSVPLVLMNSFATHAETMKALLAIDVPPSVKIMHFMQRKFPRLNPATLRPLPTSAHSQNDFWYPPGHGDVFEMIVRSGVAEKLIAQGTMYAFVSNIDNPGADLDPTIAGEMIRSDAKFLLEYTPRTPNDRSGGIMVQINGHTSCLELSQVPDTVLPQFGSLDYSAFNTNNMWMHLPTVINLVNSRQLRLRASVVLREMGSSEVLQLETAISSLHGVLEQGPLCLAVPRKRWRVIKTTADLLMVRAPRLLKLHKGRLVIHEARRIPGKESLW